MTELRIREIRQARGLKLVEVARSAGISESLLSQVERGRVDPSLETLRQVARALNAPLFELFATEQDSSQVEVITAGRETTITSPEGGLVYARKSSVGTDLEVLTAKMLPGASSRDLPWSHPAEECVLVTDGKLTVEINGSAHRLGPGDSCHFDSRLPHRFVNESDCEVEYIIAVTPPSY